MFFREQVFATGGESAPAPAKGGKAPRVSKQKLADVPGKLSKRRIEELQEQALKEMLLPGGLGGAAGSGFDITNQFGSV